MSKKAKTTETEKATSTVKVRLKGPGINHTRTLTAADFRHYNVTDQDKLVVKTGEVADVSEAAATFLVDELGEFERVKDQETSDLEDEEDDEPATNLADTVPDDVEDDEPAGSGGTAANVRDGAGSTSPGGNINR